MPIISISSILHRGFLSLVTGSALALTVLFPGGVYGFSISNGVSGSWYDPAKTGQGYTIQVLSDEVALLTWFTFDAQGNQLWMQGVGEIDSERMTFDELLRFEGPQFGPGYDPDDFASFPSGSLSIEFSDCNNAVAEFSGSDRLPADTLNITRLSFVAGFDCDSFSAPTLSGTIHSGLSGAWFDASQNGQGWMVEVLNEDLVLIYWFTYDRQGNPKWMLGVGEIEENGFFIESMEAPVGGRFGPSFDPDEVQYPYWGVLGISHVQCNRGVAAYIEAETLDSFIYGDVTPLALIAGSDACDFKESLSAISGSLVAAPHSYVDGTTNDPNAPWTSNNLPSESQSVGNPATITGFASDEPVANGRYENDSDPIDEYLIPLTAGQTLQLIIHDWDPSDPSRNDLDLYVYKAGTDELYSSALTIQKNEYIEILDTGHYEVVVHAYSGASVYSLHASFAPVPSSAEMLNVMDNFVDDEIVIEFSDEKEDRSFGSLQSHDKVSLMLDGHGVTHISGKGFGPNLVRITKDEIADSRLAQASASERASFGIEMPRLEAIVEGEKDGELSRKMVLVRTAKSLQADPQVKSAIPNVRVNSFSNDPRRNSQWHYDSVSLNQAWNITRGDSGVLVAVIDTGVAPHPDIEANVHRHLSVDTIDQIRNLGPVEQRADDPIEPWLRSQPHSHGTHVAGTVAAMADNARDGVGVAPNVGIMPIRALDSRGSGSLFATINAIYWAAGRSNIAGLDDPQSQADVINLSLGAIGTCPTLLQNAIDYAIGQGIIVIAAAGNETTSRNVLPAGCEGVISVSALNRDGNPSFYSNCGANVSVAAPGGETVPSQYNSHPFAPEDQAACRADPETFASSSTGVWSISFDYGRTSRKANFMPMDGTSMAAPHVAGIAALMKSVKSDLSPQEFDALLRSGNLTDAPSSGSWDTEYGFGSINARKALEATLDTGSSVPGSLSSSPAVLSFGDTAQTRTIQIVPVGDVAGSLDSFYQTNAPWLVSAQALDVDQEGFGSYDIGVSREGLIEGTYEGVLRAQTTDDFDVVVPVDMRVGPLTDRGEAGFLYLAFMDQLTGALVGFLGGVGFDGFYTYQIDDLVAGNYILIVFSDVGFKHQICGEGNYCGYYPGTGLLEPVIVRGGEDRGLRTITVYPDYAGVGEAGISQMLSTQSRQIGFEGMLSELTSFPFHRDVELGNQMSSEDAESPESSRMIELLHN